MTLNRGICKTPILGPKIPHGPHHIISWPQGSLHALVSLLVGGLPCELIPDHQACFAFVYLLLFICLLTKKYKNIVSLTLLLAAEAIISQLGQNQSKSVIAVDGGHSCRIWAPWSIIKSSYELWHHFGSRSQGIRAWNSSEHGSVKQNPRKSTVGQLSI